MRVTIVQTDITWACPAANRAHMDGMLRGIEGSDLIVLPEMLSTGFATNPEGIAERDGSTLAWMKAKAAEKGCAIAGSVATEADGLFYNRFYFVTEEGSTTHYDKHHLFTYSGEHHRFTAGNDRVTVEYRGVRIRLLVCYDLRFPIWSRNKADEPYDIALYVASWPTSRADAWDTLLKARAIENQCYVAGVNRVGEDPNCPYCGGSAVIDPYGRVIATCGRGNEGVVTADIDMAALKAFREKFPVLNDADKIG